MTKTKKNVAWLVLALVSMILNIILQSWGWAIVGALCTGYYIARTLYEAAP